jgi:DNA-binding NarL/FixJ family response regulator
MSSQLNPLRVILADDHAVVRAGIRQFIEHDPGLQVIAEAGNGQEACRLIDKLRPDVAVLDIQMPTMSGIEAVRWVRSQQIQVGLLILTAYDDDPYVQAVLRAGANGYVLKTSTPEEIIQAVHDVYDGKMVLDAALTQRFVNKMIGTQEPSLMEALTDRELEIITLAGKGLTNKAIGVQLGISDRTVQNHLAHIFGKLQAASRTEAVMRAVSLGLIPPSLAEMNEG